MPEVTFFMIVTPRDVVIADYAIRSYARVDDLDFTLLVYSNYLLPEQYTGNTIILNERNHTHFCMYKRMAFERSQVSHAFHRELLSEGPVERTCWDSAAYFQKSLRDQGLRFDYLHGKFRRDFIHY